MRFSSKSKNEKLFDIGSTFRQLRLRKGFKSAELFSYEHELNRTAYWRWENGENITMKNFLKLCDIHKVSPTDIFLMIDKRKLGVRNSELLNEPGSVLYKKKRTRR